MSDRAPDFTLYSHEQKPWALSDHLAEGRVLLLFFPGAFTSVCTDEMNVVNNDLTRYRDADVQVVGVSTDHPAVLAEFRRAHDLDFPLLSDHDAEVADAYGARFGEGEHRLGLTRIAKRAAFLVDRDGTLRYADVRPSPVELPDFEAIHAAMEGGGG